MRKSTLILVILVMTIQHLLAQTTTSSITGAVKAENGEPLTGATVTATHEPTGTLYRSLTRKDGRYDMVNMAPGGPYTLVISYTGYEPATRTDIFLNLGESGHFDINLTSAKNVLAEVVVTGRARANAKTGTETTIDREKMQTLPTVGRNIYDYLRAVPQLKMTSAGVSSAMEGFSIAGQNNRFNSFYIDGAVNNDVFGIAATGTNGGQSNVAPISIDAIDQFQVLISPYDASAGNFTGGAINAITKSGTNTVHGSAYYIFRNQDLAGKTPTGPKSAATKLGDFKNKTYGFTAGGPIIKNKLFYFINGELQRDETPQPFDISTYRGNTKDLTALNNLANYLRTKYGYDPGTFDNNVQEIKADRIAAKFDWNMNPKNKLTLSYRYNAGEKIFAFASSASSINFFNSGFQFPSKTHSGSVELKSSLGATSSNRLLVTLTNVVDDRGPLGGAFPSVTITDGTGQIFLGTEASSIFNYLKQNTINLLDHYKFTVGKNFFTAGVEAEYYKAYNAFIQNTLGNYQYDSLQQFLQDLKPRQYLVNFPLLDNNSDKNTASAAKFNVAREAFFINDEIRPVQNLTLTAGLRADLYQFIKDPVADPFAIDSALPKLMQYYNLRGARPGQKPKIPVTLSPRLGFTYKLPNLNLTIRGGAGLFAGRIPLVWPGGIYNNTGISSGGYTLSASNNTAIWNQNKVRFRTTPYRPEEVGLSLADAKGSLNLISKEFKLPKVFRTSLAIDKNFGKGWTTTVEGIYTKNINEVAYYNVNILPPNAKMVGPDNRNVYPSPNTIPIRSNGRNPYSAVYLLTNTKEEKGYSYNLTFTLNKSTTTGFTFNANYNYGKSYILNEATNSTNSSQWANMETVNGRNFLTRSQSDFSAGHRIFALVSKRFSYLNKKMATTLSFTYTGQSGQPFSYTYSGQLVRDGISNNDLIYVPTKEQLQTMIFLSNTISGVTYTADQQKTALESYIQNDAYLNSRRGMYAERNGSRLPFTHLVDMKIAQDFTLKLGTNTYTLQVAYSMFNFTNFLNRDWGRQYFTSSDQFQLISFASYVNASTNLTPQFRFNPTINRPGSVSTSPIPSYSSRWISQLEFRVRF